MPEQMSTLYPVEDTTPVQFCVLWQELWPVDKAALEQVHPWGDCSNAGPKYPIKFEAGAFIIALPGKTTQSDVPAVSPPNVLHPPACLLGRQSDGEGLNAVQTLQQ